MRFFKKISVIVLVVIIITVCSGCSKFVGLFEDKELRADIEEMLDAVIADDLEKACAFVDDYYSFQDAAGGIEEIKDYLSAAEVYELSLLNLNVNTNILDEDKITTTTAEYSMEANEDKFIVFVRKFSTSDDFESFRVIPYEATNYYSVGSLENMKGATAVQWILLLSNLLIVAFMVFAIVDCCRNKIRLKALWIIIIIVGFFTIAPSYSPTSFHLNFGVGFVSYTALITYGGGLNLLRIMLPIGPVVYFAARKTLLKKMQQQEPVRTLSYEPEPAEHEDNEE